MAGIEMVNKQASRAVWPIFEEQDVFRLAVSQAERQMSPYFSGRDIVVSWAPHSSSHWAQLSDTISNNIPALSETMSYHCLWSGTKSSQAQQMA